VVYHVWSSGVWLAGIRKSIVNSCCRNCRAPRDAHWKSEFSSLAHCHPPAAAVRSCGIRNPDARRTQPFTGQCELSRTMDSTMRTTAFPSQADAALPIGQDCAPGGTTADSSPAGSNESTGALGEQPQILPCSSIDCASSEERTVIISGAPAIAHCDQRRLEVRR
jgi:hypothetical protein